MYWDLFWITNHLDTFSGFSWTKTAYFCEIYRFSCQYCDIKVRGRSVIRRVLLELQHIKDPNIIIDELVILISNPNFPTEKDFEQFFFKTNIDIFFLFQQALPTSFGYFSYPNFIFFFLKKGQPLPFLFILVLFKDNFTEKV